MARLAIPPAMTPEQSAVHDEAASGRRGHAPAPLRAWIQNPELARRAQKLGELLRYETSLSPRLSELAILVTARHWTSHYEWKVHKAEALKAGLPASAIDAIARRETPAFTDPADRIVFAVSSTLLAAHAIPEPLYREAIATLGERGLVELVAVLGYYGLVSMTLNAFEIGLPEARQRDLGAE